MTKAGETRKRNRDKQQEKQREKILLREKMKAACVCVLDNPAALPADKMKAVEVLRDFMEGW